MNRATHRGWCVSWFAFVCLVGLLACTNSSEHEKLGKTRAASSTPTLVQTGSALSTFVTVPFPSAQTAGDLNLVVIGWSQASDSPAAVTSISDTVGNTYALVAGPTTIPGQMTQAIYYAKNIAGAAANANSVTVNFSLGVDYPDVRVLEYSGIDIDSSLDATAANSGSGTLTDSGTLTTTADNDLIVAANYVEHTTTGPGTGFTSRMITPDQDIVEDRLAPTAGAYNATAPMTGGSWIMQAAAFRTTPAGASFVQGNSATPSGSTLLPSASVAARFASAQQAGDLNVVSVTWGDTTSTVTSITDTAGNSYVLAAGPTTLSSLGSQSVYYAKNIASAPASSNAVTVTFSATTQYPEIRLLEYSGVDPNSPLDVALGSADFGTTATTGPITTAQANELVLIANASNSRALGPSAGATIEVNVSGDIVEDLLATAPGNYSASVALNDWGGQIAWIQQMLAFKPSSSGGSCNPATVTDNNPCTTDTCDSNGNPVFTPVASGSSCEDGNFCNGSEVCNGSGACQPGTPPNTDDGNPCTVDSCDPVTGVHHQPCSALDPTVTTTIGSATSFLYSGSNPIQTGVSAGTIAPQFAGVIRGQVRDRTGAPLSGVAIRIVDHPEFGQTTTHANGAFDMAVNGGATLELEYTLSGYLPVRRAVTVPWQDYASAPDVVLLQLDSHVTSTDLQGTASSVQVARGSVSSDSSGTRQGTLMVPPGTQAAMQLPNQTTQLSTASVRITEYTVGSNGPTQMPAPANERLHLCVRTERR